MASANTGTILARAGLERLGLGDRIKADTIELRWLSGVKETLQDVPGNHLHVCEESRGIVSSRRLRQP